MYLGVCSVDNWQFIGVSTWEGLVIEDILTCRFLSYHPRVMGLTLTFSSTESICSTNWFDNNSLPDSFRCNPCLVNIILLLTILIILTWLKILASLSNLLQVIHPCCVQCIQVRSKDSHVKTQLVLWIFIIFKVTTCFSFMTRLSSGHK
jgi:hypothetical protein